MAIASDLSTIQVSNIGVPVFISPMLKHLKKYPTNSHDSDSVVSYLLQVNDHLAAYPPSSSKSFMMSELYKSFFSEIRSKDLEGNHTHISVSNLTLVKAKLDKNKLIYSEFSQFFMIEALLSYRKYSKDNYLNNYLNRSNKKFDLPEKRKKLIRLNKFLGPWIMQFLRLSPERFNFFISDFIGDYLFNIGKLSKIIKYNNISTISQGAGMPYFKIIREKPESTSVKPTQPRRTGPKDEIKSLKNDPNTAASEKIDELMNKIDKNKP
jgi:hypothetical protein